jgi:hypothetical protein
MTSYLNLVRKSQYFDDVKGHRADTTARALRQKHNSTKSKFSIKTSRVRSVLDIFFIAFRLEKFTLIDLNIFT